MSITENQKVFSGELIEEDNEISLAQLCQFCDIQAEKIEELIDYGILEPSGKKGTHWCFHMNSIRRAQISIRLQEDLGVNLSGAALAIELLERIDTLEKRLKLARGSVTD